jgi:hypothetical protein
MIKRNPKIMWAKILVILPLLLSLQSRGQSNNYWTRSFNEESSLLSGAVVGGGSGPTSIYYNPASISEVEASKLSLNASLFSFDFINIKNGLGDDINMNMSRATVEPRFVSFMIKSKRFKNWSFEIAVLNNENTKAELNESIDKHIDILTNVQGIERYFAVYHYGNSFKDEWIGAGSSVRLSDRITAGISMFVTVKSLVYSQSLDIDAYPLDDSIAGSGDISYYVASFENTDYLKYNDYRLTWKGGLLYKADNYSIGLSITTPSLGGIYSDGKRVSRTTKQNNITMPGTGDAVPDYIITDYKEKSDVDVGFKTPFSIAAGFNYYFPGKKRSIFTSFEYFAAIDAYRLIEAEESDNIGPNFMADQVDYSEWLTYAGGAKPVFNFAFGYSTTLKKGLLLMGGFRTDFNSKKNLDYGEFADYNKTHSLNVDRYHVTCGLSWNIFGQDIITGIQYTLGHSKGQRQLANLSDPVEYNPDTGLALQGVPTYEMNSWFNAISLYFGASFNFGGEKKE